MGQVQITACTRPRGCVRARVYDKHLKITTEAIETTRRMISHCGDDLLCVAGTLLRSWPREARFSHIIWHHAYPIPRIAITSSIGHSPSRRDYVCWWISLSRGLPGHADRDRARVLWDTASPGARFRVDPTAIYSSKTVDKNWYIRVGLLFRANVLHLLATTEFVCRASSVICCQRHLLFIIQGPY